MTQPPAMPPQSTVPPQQLQYSTPTGPMTNLREVASKQKAVMYCILGYLALVVLNFVLPPELGIVLGLAMLAVSVTAAVFVFMLALSLYNTATGIILGICTLIPLVGLIILLIVNGKATAVLKRHGAKVGLMGADMATVPATLVPRG